MSGVFGRQFTEDPFIRRLSPPPQRIESSLRSMLLAGRRYTPDRDVVCVEVVRLLAVIPKGSPGSGEAALKDSSLEDKIRLDTGLFAIRIEVNAPPLDEEN
jgi:hypothetical protein